MINRLFIIIIAIVVSSCSIIKNKQHNKEKSEVHYYHDSTFVIERLTTKEIKTIGDSTTAQFLLESLLKSGYGKSVDRHFTTEIRYKDGILQVNTIMDSLLQRITEMERIKTNSKSSEYKKVNSNTKNKNVEVKNYTMIIVGVSFIILLVIIILAAIIYFKIIKTPFRVL